MEIARPRSCQGAIDLFSELTTTFKHVAGHIHLGRKHGYRRQCHAISRSKDSPRWSGQGISRYSVTAVVTDDEPHGSVGCAFLRCTCFW